MNRLANVETQYCGLRHAFIVVSLIIELYLPEAVMLIFDFRFNNRSCLRFQRWSIQGTHQQVYWVIRTHSIVQDEKSRRQPAGLYHWYQCDSSAPSSGLHKPQHQSASLTRITRAPSQYKGRLSRYGDSHIKDKTAVQCWDHWPNDWAYCWHKPECIVPTRPVLLTNSLFVCNHFVSRPGFEIKICIWSKKIGTMMYFSCQERFIFLDPPAFSIY